MAGRKYSRRSNTPFDEGRIPDENEKYGLAPIVEEIIDEENVAQMAPHKLTRSHRCCNALSQLLLPSPEKPLFPQKSPKKSHSKAKNDAKLPEEYSQPPPVPAKLHKHDARPAPDRAPPPPPPFQQQARSSSNPRTENTSILRKPISSTNLRQTASPTRNKPNSRNQSPIQQQRQRSISLAPPMAPNSGQTRVVSSPTNSRPTSYHSDQESNRTSKLNKRKSWLGGLSRSRNPSADLGLGHLPTAWVVIEGQQMDYNLSILTNGDKMAELVAEQGDTFVYLFPRDSSGHKTQMKIHSPALASSPLLRMPDNDANPSAPRKRARSFDGRRNLGIKDAMRNLDPSGRETPPQFGRQTDNQSTSDGSNESVRSLTEGPREFHLFFQTKLSNDPKFSEQDVQRLVDVRNLFAFLEGQVLVRTRATPTTFDILIAVASLLKEFEFSNVDQSTYGEAVTAAFEFLLTQKRFGDVSESRQKTIEGIILGERMRSTDLYNEAFAHAVGKYEDVKAVNPELFSQISNNTRNRLERAFLDLGQRQRAANQRLTDFEFPSLFAGIAASTSSAESKFIRFKSWKAHFMSLRKATLSYYKDLHGQWPPKASSKKNNFVEGGLNRLVLKGLYNDLCGLYNLLVDRESFTTRGYDPSEDKNSPTVDPTAAALRRLLGEFDRSSPPVTPPIPFDIPRIPTMATLDPSYVNMGPKEQNTLANKKLKDHETQLIVAKSHNLYTVKNTPFLGMFNTFESKEVRGKTCAQLADMRYGYWIFLYAVLQSLPMLVVDAPGLHYTDGVEYFLCEPSMGNPPWMEDATVKREWYGVGNSGQAVVLPSDLVDHGVEGVFRRSHCWTMANKWINEQETGSIATVETEPSRSETLSRLQPPPGFTGGELGVRPSAREENRDFSDSSESLAAERRGRSRQSQRNSVAIGLNRLPIPMGHTSPSLAATASRGNSPGGLNLYDKNGRRVSSSGPSGTGTPTSGSEYKGSTFDDILGSMDNEQALPKEERRKSVMSRFM